MFRIARNISAISISLALSASLASALDSGIFTSFSVGAHLQNNDFTRNFNGAVIGSGANGGSGTLAGTSQGSSSTNTYSSSLNYGLRLGYVFALNDYNALRAYGSYSLGKVSIGTESNGAKYQGYELRDAFMHYVGVGLDYVLSFSAKKNAWGLFIGGGYEYTLGNAKEKLESISKNQPKELNYHLPYAQAGITKYFGSGRVGVEIGYRQYFSTMYSQDKISFPQWKLDEYSTQSSNEVSFSTGTFARLYAAINVNF